MDGIVVVVIILVYVFASLDKSAKKKKQRARIKGATEQGQRRTVRSMPKAAFADDEGEAMLAAAESANVFAEAEEGEDPCHETMMMPKRESMRVQRVQESDMENAGEGEDPCHVHGAAAQDEPEIEDAQEWDSLQQEVLRGIVMSEVLMRPDERAAVRRTRQRRRY